jgi:hypothetical protein
VIEKGTPFCCQQNLAGLLTRAAKTASTEKQCWLGRRFVYVTCPVAGRLSECPQAL